MSILNQLASSLGRRDDVPNQELAKHLVKTRDVTGIQEVVGYLKHAEPEVQSDCIKVLYEVGYIEPSLIADYWKEFLELLGSKNNRLVWGGMIALGTIAGVCADELFPQRGWIVTALEKGSVIVQDNAVKALARMASTKDEYRDKILPILFKHLECCRAKDLPQHAESVLMAINENHRGQFNALLESRMEEMSDSQMKRLQKVIYKVGE